MTGAGGALAQAANAVVSKKMIRVRICKARSFQSCCFVARMALWEKVHRRQRKVKPSGAPGDSPRAPGLSEALVEAGRDVGGKAWA